MTQTNPSHMLGGQWASIQTWLIPALEDEIGELDEKHRQFVSVCELCEPRNFMAAYRWIGIGGPPSDRLALCKAFIAKAVWDFATTRDLLDAVRHRPALRRLCGWESLGEVPSEATFSRAFNTFARDELPQRIHEALIKTRCGDKAHLDVIDGDIPVSFILTSAARTRRNDPSADGDQAERA